MTLLIISRSMLRVATPTPVLRLKVYFFFSVQWPHYGDHILVP